MLAVASLLQLCNLVALYGVPFRPLRHVVAAVRTLWSDQDTQCSVFIAGY